MAKQIKLIDVAKRAVQLASSTGASIEEACKTAYREYGIDNPEMRMVVAELVKVVPKMASRRPT